jgi:hypothetical protein
MGAVTTGQADTCWTVRFDANRKVVGSNPTSASKLQVRALAPAVGGRLGPDPLLGLLLAAG